MKNKYQQIASLSKDLKSIEMDLCWELRSFKGNPRPLAKARREKIRELAEVR